MIIKNLKKYFTFEVGRDLFVESLLVMISLVVVRLQVLSWGAYNSFSSSKMDAWRKHVEEMMTLCILNPASPSHNAVWGRLKKVTVLDDKEVRRRFRASNYQSTTRRDWWFWGNDGIVTWSVNYQLFLQGLHSEEKIEFQESKGSRVKWIVWGSCLVRSRPLTLTSFDLHVQLATPAVCIVHNCLKFKPVFKKIRKQHKNKIRIAKSTFAVYIFVKIDDWKMNFAEKHDPLSGHTFIFRLRGGG